MFTDKGISLPSKQHYIEQLSCMRGEASKERNVYLAGLRGHDRDGAREARLAGARLHGGERGFDEVEGAHEVDVHHPLDLLHVLPLELLRHEHAVVADQHVDGPGLPERARHGVRVPHVGRVDADVAAAGLALDGGARLLEAGEVAGQDGDPRALPRRGRGHGEPDAAGPARDEDVAAFERDARGAGARQEGERGEEADGRDQQEEERRGHGGGRSVDWC